MWMQQYEIARLVFHGVGCYMVVLDKLVIELLLTRLMEETIVWEHIP